MGNDKGVCCIQYDLYGCNCLDNWVMVALGGINMCDDTGDGIL